MKVITELELREIYKKNPFTSFDLPSGMKLTPAASQFLSERKIKILRDGVEESQLAKEDRRFNVSAPTPAYPKAPPSPQPLAEGGVPEARQTVPNAQSGYQPVQPIPRYQQQVPAVSEGAAIPPVQPVQQPVQPTSPVRERREPRKDTTAQNMDTSHVSQEKPEHMSHLRGAELVPKTHPMIAFRGQLDTFEACVLSGVIEAKMSGFEGLAEDLTELLEYARGIMRAEVRQEPLAPIQICGWDAAEIRERSHYPNKFYNVNHFTPQPEHGKIMAMLNLMRAKSRELELSAAHAFYHEDGSTDRDDILQAVNRFSSLIYVFMLQLLAGVYKYGC